MVGAPLPSEAIVDTLLDGLRRAGLRLSED
jgi:hypothetical protein